MHAATCPGHPPGISRFANGGQDRFATRPRHATHPGQRCPERLRPERCHLPARLGTHPARRQGLSFIELNDGSCLKGLQIIVDATLPDYAQVTKANTGASVEVQGRLVESKGQGQKWEVVATRFTVLGEADAAYPLQKKGHTLEFLREIAHLRPRSNLFGAVFRVRSRLAYAVHHRQRRRGRGRHVPGHDA